MGVRLMSLIPIQNSGGLTLIIILLIGYMTYYLVIKNSMQYNESIYKLQYCVIAFKLHFAIIN